MSTKTGRFELKLEDRSLITCFRDCWVVATNYLYEIAPKRYTSSTFLPHNGLPVLNVYGEVKKPSPVPITAEVLAGVWNALVATDRRNAILMDIGTAIAQAREDYQFDKGICPKVEQVSHTYPKVRALVEVYRAVCDRLTHTFAYPIQGYEALSLDSIDVEGIEAKANAYLLHQEQVSMSMDDVIPELGDYSAAQELQHTKSALTDCRAKLKRTEQEQARKVEELETIKKELESKAQALAEALGRIAELEQEIAGLHAKKNDNARFWGLLCRDGTNETTYQRVLELTTIVERAKGIKLLDTDECGRLIFKYKPKSGFPTIANCYRFVEKLQERYQFGHDYKALIVSELIGGLSVTQLEDAKHTYKTKGSKPRNNELIDELFVSL